MVLADLGIFWVFAGIGQRHEDHPPLERPEGPPVDASETPQEILAALPGEAPYPISDASTTTPTRTEAVTCLGILEGEFGYRPSYGRGYIGNPLM